MNRRHSRAVYRRRRIVVFGALLIVLAAVGFGIWLLFAQPWAAGAQEEPAPTSVAEGGEASDPPDLSATPEDDPEDAGEETESTEPEDAEPEDAGSEGTEAPPVVGSCEEPAIEVRAETDATSYRSGALPQMSIRLQNTGDVDCTINVGSSTQVFTVTSGRDVWWRSTDCQETPSDMTVTLGAGQSVTSAEPVQWDRTRSSVNTCEQGNRPRAPAGGASYHVTVEIGGFVGSGSKQILLY